MNHITTGLENIVIFSKISAVLYISDIYFFEAICYKLTNYHLSYVIIPPHSPQKGDFWCSLQDFTNHFTLQQKY